MYLEIPMTEEQQGALNWFRAQVSRGFAGTVCVTTDYCEKSPVYIGEVEDLEKIIEMAAEDYADWDES